MTTLDLRRLRLRPGEQLVEQQEVEISPLELGGQRYIAVPERVTAEVRVTRTTDGTLLELQFAVRLHGPCFRCLGDAVLEQDVGVREYQADAPGETEELMSPYVGAGRIDLSAWARDSVSLALPDKILCRDDCAGLCPVCGRNLNDEPHEHEQPGGDPRWAALERLREQG